MTKAKKPVLMKPVNLFLDLLNNERTAGLLLVICTAISLWLTNSPAGPEYVAFWDQQFASHSVTHWINDGLMAIFFLMIGLELEREVYIGELSNMKKTALSVFKINQGMDR